MSSVELGLRAGDGGRGRRAGRPVRDDGGGAVASPGSGLMGQC
jgi:hypothetical protein